MIPETITYVEAAELCNCNRKAIKAAVDARKIDAYRPGKKYLLNKKQVEDWFMSTKIYRNSRDPRR